MSNNAPQDTNEQTLSTFELLYEPITPVNPSSLTAESIQNATFPALPRAFRLPAEASGTGSASFIVPIALQGFFLPISVLSSALSLQLTFYTDSNGINQLVNNVLAITTIGSGTMPSIGQVSQLGSSSVAVYNLPEQIPAGESAFFGLVPNYPKLDPGTPLEVRGYVTIQATGSSGGPLLLSPQTRTVNLVNYVTLKITLTNEFIYPLPTPNGAALFNLGPS